MRMLGARRRGRRRAREAWSGRPRPLAPSPRLARPTWGACADDAGRRAAGRDSRRLRRAAASLARTDAIIASPRQTPREFRSPHGNCSSRSRSRLHLPLPAGRERERERDLPSSLLPAPSSGRRARARRPRPGRPARPANGPPLSALTPLGALRAALGPGGALSSPGPPSRFLRLLRPGPAAPSASPPSPRGPSPPRPPAAPRVAGRAPASLPPRGRAPRRWDRRGGRAGRPRLRAVAGRPCHLSGTRGDDTASKARAGGRCQADLRSGVCPGAPAGKSAHPDLAEGSRRKGGGRCGLRESPGPRGRVRGLVPPPLWFRPS